MVQSNFDGSWSVLIITDTGECDRAYDTAIERAFTEFSLKLPTIASVTVCHGFGCTYRTKIGLGSGDRAKLAGLLATSRASAAAERKLWRPRQLGLIAV